MLNVNWEKMPENVFYEATEQTVQQLPEGVNMIDYTAMESHVWEEATGRMSRYIQYNYIYV